MKVETWNGYKIRFVLKDGEWWAVLKDVCEALNLRAKKVAERLDDEVLKRGTLNDVNGRPHEYLLVNEFGIYDTIFRSNKPEAHDFKRWVYEMLKELRQAIGLEGYQVFRTLDKEHQKAMMLHLRDDKKHPVRVDFIKANTIANKAVSNKHGYSKMLKKDEMTPQMLVDREPILEDTVELMLIDDKYDLGISVSEKIYQKHN